MSARHRTARPRAPAGHEEREFMMSFPLHDETTAPKASRVGLSATKKNMAYAPLNSSGRERFHVWNLRGKLLRQ